MKILVTDGICPSTPAIIESLRKLDHQVYCCEETRWNASFFSKYLHKGIVTPSSENEPEEFGESLLNLLDKYKIDILIPVRDATIDVVQKNRERFSQKVKFLLPEYEDWLNGESKIRTMKIAQENGFPIPKTVFGQKRGYQELCSYLGSPFLIKLSFSSGSRGVYSVKTDKDFHERCEGLLRKGEEFYFQELIPPGGRTYNPSYIYDFDHKLVAWFLYEQLRTYPINGGTTSFGISRFDEQVLLDGKALIDKMNWVGPVEIDILEDPRDGVLKILEVNPRYWTPLLLAIKSGVDYPKIMLDVLTGQEAEETFTYKTDITYSFIPYELIHFFNRKNLKALKSLFPSKTHCDVFINPNDPGLVIGLFFQLFYILLKKRQRYMIRSRV